MKFVPRELEETADISSGKHTWRSALKYTATVLGVLGLGYLLLGLLADALVWRISEPTEAELFSWNPTAFERPGDHPGLARARAIFSRLTKAPELRPLPYHLFLSNQDSPNAISLPGGAVGVTAPLLDVVHGERGLAMVLGHELGHEQYRHTLERMGRLLLQRGALVLLFGGDGALGAGMDAAEARFSRAQERQADAFGLRLVAETYGDTDGALEFFELVQRERDEPRWGVLGASHPLTAERLADLRALQRELEAGK